MQNDQLDAAVRDSALLLSLLPGARPHGSGWRARCPIHRGSHGSFAVTKAREGRWLWRCFVCNVGGNVFNLKMSLDGCTFPEACERLGLTREKAERPPATGAELDAYRERQLEHMARPASPWDATDWVYLYCDCPDWAGIRLNTPPNGLGRMRRERLACDACNPAPVRDERPEAKAWADAFCRSVAASIVEND